MMVKSSRPNRERSFPATGLGFLGPPTIWALLFAALYAVQGATCAGTMAGAAIMGVPLMHALKLMLSIFACVLIAMVGLRAWTGYRQPDRVEEAADLPWRETGKTERFLLAAVMLNSGLFLVASLWVSVPLLLLPPC